LIQTIHGKKSRQAVPCILTTDEKKQKCVTVKKEKRIFLIKENSEGTGCKVIYEEGLPNI